MNDELTKKIFILKEEVDELKITEEDKVLLLSIIKGLINAPHGRIYIKDLEDGKEYLSLKISKEDKKEKIKVCITEQMIEQSGATGGRRNTFPEYGDLLKYIHTNQKEIESQLKSIEYYTNQKNKPQKEEISISEVVKNKISKMPASEHKKARVYAVLDELSTEIGKKVYSVRENEYEEYLTIINNSINVIQKMTDYGGGIQGRKKFIITSEHLIDYIEQNKETIDESLGKKHHK